MDTIKKQPTQKQFLYALIKRSDKAQASSAYKDTLLAKLHAEQRKNHFTLSYSFMRKLFLVTGGIAVPILAIGLVMFLTHPWMPVNRTQDQLGSTTQQTIPVTPSILNGTSAGSVASQLDSLQQQMDANISSATNSYNAMNSSINNADQDTYNSTSISQL